MTTTSTKSGTASTAKPKTKTVKKKALAGQALSTCPSSGGGWCSYPFSPAQLEKKLKAKAKEKEEAAAEIEPSKKRKSPATSAND